MRINADGSVIMPFAVSASANTIRTSMPVNITADKAIRHTVLGMRANLHTVFVCIKSPHIYVLWAVLRFFASYTPFCFTITIIITYLTCRCQIKVPISALVTTRFSQAQV